MTEAADDPLNVIVGYGIADCVSRMVVMRKRDLALRLFSDLGTFTPFNPNFTSDHHT